MQAGTIHPVLDPLKWIIGKWKSINAEGFYPTIKPFSYCEELTFTSVGQPIINYNSLTWHPTKLNPMHLETGFLRIKPGTTDVSLIVAHNFGLTSLEAGCVNGNSLEFNSSQISRMSFTKTPHVTEIIRSYKLTAEGTLEFNLSMATTTTPLSQHLKVIYEKI